MTNRHPADRLLGQDILIRAPHGEELVTLAEKLEGYHQPRVIEVRSSKRLAGIIGWRGKGLWIEIDPAHRRRGRGRLALALWISALLDNEESATIIGPLSAIAEDFLRRFRFTASPDGWTSSAQTRSQIDGLFAVDESRYIQRTHMTLLEMGIPPDWPAQSKLPLCCEPRALNNVGKDIFDRDQWLRPDAADAWEKMDKDAEEDGVKLGLVSAFRSFNYQVDIIKRKMDAGQSMGQILSVSAAPGYSEHHTGRAIDLTTDDTEPLEQDFEKTEAFQWLESNAEKFGYRLSYPRDNPHGVAYEPWHWMFHA